MVWSTVSEIERRAERRPTSPSAPQLAHRACQISGPGFEFLEQPHVLDGDHGLVSERLEKLDLLVRERVGPRPDGSQMVPSGMPSRRSGVAR
jgi:hypothetical protein